MERVGVWGVWRRGEDERKYLHAQRGLAARREAELGEGVSMYRGPCRDRVVSSQIELGGRPSPQPPPLHGPGQVVCAHGGDAIELGLVSEALLWHERGARLHALCTRNEGG